MDQNTRKMFQRGVEALKAGERATARSLLLQVAARAPEHQDAWLWLSDAAETPYERREYLERCVIQDPQSRAADIARKKINRLEWELLVTEDDPIPSARTALPPETKRLHLSMGKMALFVVISLVVIWGGMVMGFNHLSNLSNQPDDPTNEVIADISASPADNQQPAVPSITTVPAPNNNQTVSAQTIEETPLATQPAAVPYPADQPTAHTQGPQVVSRGMGLDRSQWEAMHGQAEQTLDHMATYDNGRYQLSFRENKIELLQEQVSQDEEVSLGEARILSQQFLPTDSRAIGTSAAPDGSGITIDIYQSDWLGEQFSNWSDSEPGTFTIIYHTSGDMIRYYDIQLGDVR
jgi:hypothetical protein